MQRTAAFWLGYSEQSRELKFSNPFKEGTYDHSQYVEGRQVADAEESADAIYLREGGEAIGFV